MIENMTPAIKDCVVERVEDLLKLIVMCIRLRSERLRKYTRPNLFLDSNA